MTVTWCPKLNKRPTRLVPMNPAPPAIILWKTTNNTRQKFIIEKCNNGIRASMRTLNLICLTFFAINTCQFYWAVMIYFRARTIWAKCLFILSWFNGFSAKKPPVGLSDASSDRLVGAFINFYRPRTYFWKNPPIRATQISIAYGNGRQLDISVRISWEDGPKPGGARGAVLWGQKLT